MEEKSSKKHKKRKRARKGAVLGPLVVCKHCSRYTRVIETHLKYVHGIRNNISEHFWTLKEWKIIKAQRERERQERQRKRMEDPNYIPCGTKIHKSQYIKIISTPMGGARKRF